MPHHCAIVEIATREHSAENVILIHHVRSHCRGLKSVSSRSIPCQKTGTVLQATLEFSREGDRKFSLDRLQRACYRGTRLTITTSTEFLRNENGEGSVLQRSARLDLIVSVLGPKEPNLAGLEQHIIAHTGGSIDRYIVGRSKTGRSKINCTIRIAAKDGVSRLRQSTFQGRQVDVEVRKSPHSRGSPSHTPAFPLSFLAPVNHPRSPRVSASHHNNPMVDQRFDLVISSLGFTTSPDVKQIEHHIAIYSGGTVGDLRLGCSRSGHAKVTCSVHTSKNAPLKRLRQSRYNGEALDVEVLRNNTSNTSSAGSTSTLKSIPTVLSLRLSSLPPSVDVKGLEHHIRSHTGGQVSQLLLTASPNGGMEATFTIHTRIDSQSAVDRLQSARFRGMKVHAEHINHSTPLPGPSSRLHHNLLPGTAREPCATVDRKEARHSQRQAMSPNRAQLAMIRAVATNFTRFLSLDPSRLDRSQDEQGIEDLYQEFLLDRLSVTVSKAHDAEIDDESSIYSDMHSLKSPAASLMGVSEPTNYQPIASRKATRPDELPKANATANGPGAPTASSTSNTADLLAPPLPPVDHVSIESTDGQSHFSSDSDAEDISDEYVSSVSLDELRSTEANETYAGGIFDVIGRHMAESGEWSIVP